jgi:hypothetical protein
MEGFAVKRTIASKFGIVELPVLEVKLLPIHKIIATEEPIQELVLESLRDSILKNGVYAPILVTWRAEEGKYFVIDGKKRYILFRDIIFAKEIPAVVLDRPEVPQDDLVNEISMKKDFKEMSIRKWRKIL